MNIMENGISENELEDILSLDDDLLTQIFEFHSPPLRRFPIALWFRIKHVMKEYLVEKEIDDTNYFKQNFVTDCSADSIDSQDFGKELPCFGELKDSRMNLSKYSAKTKNNG